MHPVKIVLIAILLYLLYRLVRGSGKNRRSVSGSQDRQESLPTHDVLIRDPICHIYIPKGQAVVLQEKEGPVHFCSEGCRQAYVKSRKTT